MKKLLLIALIGVAIIFTNCSAEAKVFPPLQYSSSFNINLEPQTDLERNLMQVVYNFRYADTIFITNINSYAKLFNIQVDPSFNTNDAREAFIDVYGSYSNKKLTNDGFGRIFYIVYYQSKHQAELNKKIAEFTDVQKKQYLAIAYNVELASMLYNSATSELNGLINSNYSALAESNSGVQGFKAIIACLNADNQLADTVYSNMASLANSKGLKLVRVLPNSNVAKNANNLYTQGSPIVVTSQVVKVKEADAQIQYFNLATAGNPNNWSQAELNAVWGVKGKLYGIKDDYAEALKCYNKAIELNPSNANYFKERGFAKFNLADFSGALSDYTKAIELGSNDVTNYYNRACAKVLIGQNESAANDFKKVAQMSQYSNNTSLAALAVTYNKALSESDKDNSDFVKNKIFFENPIMLRNYMKKNGTMPIDVKGNSSQQEANKKASEMVKQMTTNQQQKPIIPPGCRVYMIIGRLKDSHTEVRYTTIAQINKIQDIVNADPRFEWVKYETVPDSYLDRYPRY